MGTSSSGSYSFVIASVMKVSPTPIMPRCGSGVTACVLLFGAHLLGKEDLRLYDGSWSEWGADPATPKALGPA